MRPSTPVRTSGWAARLLAAAGLLALLSGCSQVEPPSPELLAEARGEQCVEDTDFMRAAHMDILMVERDQAKRLGLRNEQHSFVGCINCHVAPTASKEDPASHFCLACHQFNAVRMDCFQCHLDRPDEAVTRTTQIDPIPSGVLSLHARPGLGTELNARGLP